jgi:hypothetical protein
LKGTREVWDLSTSHTFLTTVANLVEINLKQAANILIITSADPRLAQTLYASNISERFMGLPEVLEADKREIAKNILSLDSDFGSIY